MVNIILATDTDPSDAEMYAGDINRDSFIDVFDVILLVEIVMGN